MKATIFDISRNSYVDGPGIRTTVFFKGCNFQLNYVSRDELIAAKECPENYKNLRVRVTGFSDYFVKLNEAIQDDIIARTEQK